MSNAPDTEPKFPGHWEWIGFACEAGRVAVAQIASTAGQPRVVGVWNAKVEGDPLLVVRDLVGQKVARKTPSCVMLHEDHYEVLVLDEPDVKNVDAAQKLQALRWSVAPLVPFPMERASIDILIPAGTAGRHEVMAAVASEAEIAPWVCNSVKHRINLRAIDVRETAQRNLAHLFERNNRTLGLLILSGTRALLTLSANGELLMTRRIDIGAIDVVMDDDRLRDRIALEVRRTLDNYERQSGQSGNTDLLLGPGPVADDLAGHLRDQLGIPATCIDRDAISQVLSLSPDQVPEQWGGLELLAIGAACRGVQA